MVTVLVVGVHPWARLFMYTWLHDTMVIIYFLIHTLFCT